MTSNTPKSCQCPSIVVKRSKKREEAFSVEKLRRRIEGCSDGLALAGSAGTAQYPYGGIDVDAIIAQTIEGLYDGMPASCLVQISTKELDEYLEEVCAYQQQNHPDFAVLAGRLVASRLWKDVQGSFSEVIERLHAFVNDAGLHSPLIDDKTYDFVMQNRDVLDNAIRKERDFRFDYMGIRTLLAVHLLRVDKDKVGETPQGMYMRIACGIYCGDLEAALQTYDLLSTGAYSHATTTMCYAGTPKFQAASCFLQTALEDSIEGIFETLKRTAIISASGGGVAVALHHVRPAGAHIHDLRSEAKGLLPLLKIFNSTARYLSKKRSSAFAFYLETWHPDLFDFVDIRRAGGVEDRRARDIFPALWVSDLFMRRVEEDALWSFLHPGVCPGLEKTWGADFEQRYEELERRGDGVLQQMPARKVWSHILQAKIETGTPYIVFKDACNMRSNQKNRGCIATSNLCTEVVQFTDAKEVAVCTLASINLAPLYISENAGTSNGTVGSQEALKQRLNLTELRRVVRHAVMTLDRTIDCSWNPIPEARRSQERNRALGIGVQGLADLLAVMGLPFDSPQAVVVNRLLFEHIYYAAVEASVQLAQKLRPYPTFAGSPASQGMLQFDLCWLDAKRRSGERADPLEAPCKCHCHKLCRISAPAPSENETGVPSQSSLSPQDSPPSQNRPARSNPHTFESCCPCYMPLNLLDADLDWVGLKYQLVQHGMRNSLLIALMPTASTAQLQRNCEGFEPCSSNLYVRRVAAGEFVMLNRYLVNSLIEKGLWGESMKERILLDNGSVQKNPLVPRDLRAIFKTAWEISQKTIINLARDRGLFVDQSQSLNLFLPNPSKAQVTSMLFYAWKTGLKTGSLLVQSAIITPRTSKH